MDFVLAYARSRGLEIGRRSLLVEGATDARLFRLASDLEQARTGTTLLDTDFRVVSAGDGAEGGAFGVVRELVALRGLARASLTEAGVPRYRFAGLFDNDAAGRKALSSILTVDYSVLEFRDVVTLLPVMPDLNFATTDPSGLKRASEAANLPFRGLDWEIEDLIPESLLSQFLLEQPTAVSRTTSKAGRYHRDFTSDGKARLHRFVTQNAIRADLSEVIRVLRILRFYLGAPRL